jgi:hypothetical protein
MAKESTGPRMDKRRDIGFIGLGTMGQIMAINLVRTGESITVWNRSAGKCEPLRAVGAKVVADSAAVFSQTGIIAAARCRRGALHRSAGLRSRIGRYRCCPARDRGVNRGRRQPNLRSSASVRAGVRQGPGDILRALRNALVMWPRFAKPAAQGGVG